MGETVYDIYTVMEMSERTVSMIERGKGPPAWEEEERDTEREALASHLTSLDPMVNDYWREKYKKECGVNWDKFYNRHKTNFFKDRHHLEKVFGEELNTAVEEEGEDGGRFLSDSMGDRDMVMLEVGCGVGNAFYPLLASYPHLRVYGCDFSKTAIELCKKNELYDADRVTVWTHDASKEPLPDFVPKELDLVLIYFVLSAVARENFGVFVRHAVSNLREGGVVLIRDYGRFDQAQVRFALEKRANKLEDNLYVRQDGTLAYYFTTGEIEELFTREGLERVENEYIRRVYRNRKSGQEMHRIWVQAKFRKPISARNTTDVK